MSNSYHLMLLSFIMCLLLPFYDLCYFLYFFFYMFVFYLLFCIVAHHNFVGMVYI